MCHSHSWWRGFWRTCEWRGIELRLLLTRSWRDSGATATASSVELETHILSFMSESRSVWSRECIERNLSEFIPNYNDFRNIFRLELEFAVLHLERNNDSLLFQNLFKRACIQTGKWWSWHSHVRSSFLHMFYLSSERSLFFGVDDLAHSLY